MNARKLLILMPLLLVFVTALAGQYRTYADDLFFSEYIEGSSNNKAIEIFNGTGATVNLTGYIVKLASNGGNWSTTNILNMTGTLSHGDVYVIANSQANAAILAVSDITSTVTFFNGDDALGLFYGDTLIDIIGIYQNDPGVGWPVAGIPDATLNRTLIRKPTVIAGNTNWNASAGTNAQDSEWIVEAQDYVTNLGMHTFEPGGGNTAAAPSFTPGGGLYTQPVSVTISSATAGASIFYTIDGSTPSPSSTPYTAPVSISSTTTLKAIATAAGMDPSGVATAVYNFPINVANLTALRALPADGTTIYRVSGEIVLTFQQTFRNQKYLQDSGAGILIDDQNNVFGGNYNVGDGLTGIVGKISEFGGMLQFVPSMAGPQASSTNNPIIPVEINFDQMINEFDTFESRVVKVMGVEFVNPTGNFANGIVYACFDPDTDFNIRTTFYDVDYIGTPIPTTPKDIVGIPNSRVDGAYFTPRNLADFMDPTGSVAAPVFNPGGGVYYSPVSISMSSATAGASIHYTLDGSTPSAASTQYTAPITIGATTTLKAIAVLPGSPSSGITTAVYSFPVNVANMTALRSSPLNGLYRLQGEVLLSFQQSFRNQKFVQDNTGAILIDDLNGVITQTYNVGDGITGLVGTLTEFGGMMQLVPAQNPGAPSSTGNQIVPAAITLAQFLSEFETWESRLVSIQGVRITAGTYANGTIYPLTDPADNTTASFRTTFYDVDYIGLPGQTWKMNLTGIPNSRTDGTYFTARNLADFQINDTLIPMVFFPNVINPSTVQFDVGFNTANNVTVPLGLTAIRIYRNNIMIHEAAPALTITYTDTNIPGGTHVYHATAMYGAVETAGTQSFTHIVTAVDDPSVPMAATLLKGNHPNPFNPSTTITYSVKESAPVSISIFNARGQLVRHLLNDTKAAGEHRIVWDGKDDNGREMSSGVYYFRMHSGKYSSTRKMLMLK